MYKESEAMREIHKIRENLYNEEKNLSTSELITKINSEALAAKKKYRIRFRKVAYRRKAA